MQLMQAVRVQVETGHEVAQELVSDNAANRNFTQNPIESFCQIQIKNR